MKSRRLRIFLSTMAALLLGTLPVQAQDRSFTFMASHWLPSSHLLHKALEDWSASLAQASGGTIKVDVRPARELGKAFDHYDLARSGGADIALVNPGFQPGRFPIFGAGELPLLVGEAKGGSRAIDAWYRRYADLEMNDVKFCLAFVQEPGSFLSKSRKIASPSDLKGVRIRPANATVGAWVRALGGIPMNIGVPEARELPQKNIVEDGFAASAGPATLFGYDRITKFLLDMPLHTTPLAVVLNRKRYEELPDAQRQAVDAHCSNDWSARIAEPWIDFERAGGVKLKSEAGREVHLPPEPSAWRKSVEPLIERWAAGVRKAGGEPDMILADLKALLGAFNAGCSAGEPVGRAASPRESPDRFC